MPHDQDFIKILRQSLSNCRAKLGHPRLKLRRVCPPVARRIGIIMHEIIDKKLGVLLLKPSKKPPSHTKPKHKANIRSKPSQLWNKAEQKAHTTHHTPCCPKRQKCLHYQHQHRIKRRNNRALPEPHEPPKRARADIGPSCAQHRAVSGRYRVAHTVPHNIRPD